MEVASAIFGAAGAESSRRPPADHRHRAHSRPADPPGGERKNAQNRGRRCNAKWTRWGPGLRPEESGGWAGISAQNVLLGIDRHAVEADFIVHMGAGAAAGAAHQADRVAPLDVIASIDERF